MKNRFYGRNVTGSFENCSVIHQEIRINTVRQNLISVACQEITYRVPNANSGHSCDIMCGILSQADGNGPLRRKAIRNTWIPDLDTKVQAYFIVPGVWEDIREEFERYQDMI